MSISFEPDEPEYEYPSQPMRYVVDEVIEETMLAGYDRLDESPTWDGWDNSLLPPREHAVYVLECQKPIVPDFDAYVARKLEGRTDDKAPTVWVDEARSADRVFYVGCTSYFHERIVRHVCDTETGALFTTVFPPKRIHEVRWYDSRTEAHRYEQITGDEFRAKAGWFAYQM